jgi:hypothetical protein
MRAKLLRAGRWPKGRQSRRPPLMINDFAEVQLFVEWTPIERRVFLSHLSEREKQSFLSRSNF